VASITEFDSDRFQTVHCYLIALEVLDNMPHDKVCACACLSVCVCVRACPIMCNTRIVTLDTIPLTYSTQILIL
jgi:hypothetical protein